MGMNCVYKPNQDAGVWLMECIQTKNRLESEFFI